MPKGWILDPSLIGIKNCNQIAQHAKDMIARQYGGGPIASENYIVTPKIVQELSADTPIHNTDTGKLLRLCP